MGWAGSCLNFWISWSLGYLIYLGGGAPRNSTLAAAEIIFPPLAVLLVFIVSSVYEQ